MDLLIRMHESYGMDLVRESLGELNRNSIYVHLKRLKESGLVESWDTETPIGLQGPPRRLYRATRLGNRLMKAEYAARKARTQALRTAV